MALFNPVVLPDPFANFNILAHGANPNFFGISTDSMDPPLKSHVDGFLGRCLLPGDVVLIDAPYTGDPCDPRAHPQVARCAERIHQLGVQVFGWDATIHPDDQGLVMQQDRVRAVQEALLQLCHLEDENNWAPLQALWNRADTHHAAMGAELQQRQLARGLPIPGAVEKANFLNLLLPNLQPVFDDGGRVFVLYEDCAQDVLITQRLQAMGATVITPMEDLPIDDNTVGREMRFIAP